MPVIPTCLPRWSRGLVIRPLRSVIRHAGLQVRLHDLKRSHATAVANQGTPGQGHPGASGAQPPIHNHKLLLTRGTTRAGGSCEGVRSGAPEHPGGAAGCWPSCWHITNCPRWRPELCWENVGGSGEQGHTVADCMCPWKAGLSSDPLWWARWESNPHGLPRRILSPLRLPFRHSPE